MNPEARLQREAMQALSRGNVRLFRINVGQAWTGNTVVRGKSGEPIHVALRPGDVLIRGARPFNNGVKGMSDNIGWKSVTITPDMVGQKVAVFSAVEYKTGKGRSTKEQRNFIEVVRASGGYAGVVRSVEDGRKLFEGTNSEQGNPEGENENETLDR